MAQSTYTYELDEGQQNLLLLIMERGNYRKREVPYSLMSIDGDGFNCTLYEKVKHGRRKCCVQGGKAEDFVLFVLEPQVLGAATIGYEQVLDPERDKPHGGSDESGKGDYFGPLVVACCYVDEALSAQLREIGARDCKQMTDKSVLAVGSKIRHLLGPSRWAFVKIGPAAYNRLYAKIKNINRLLAWAHGVCIESLLEKQPSCPRVVVDQFAPTETVIKRALKERGRKIRVDQRHKAESDVAVAAASVVARELFLRSLISSLPDYGLAAATEEDPIGAIPKGSSDPRIRELAEKCVRANGPKWVMDHCKAHFQTTDNVLSACGFSRTDLPPEGQVVSASKVDTEKKGLK
ncbi:MAG: ribonuclease HIII [Verrucomicrobiota bacterium]|nr:ribonuclease HIII [Verrucomicrobiota bacterium]